MTVHHINPHVINNHKDSDNNNNNSNSSNPFEFNNLNNLFKNMNNMTFKDDFNNSNNPNVHTFSSTVTNNNGHVTKHVNVNGHQTSGKDADKLLNEMKNQQQKAHHNFLDHFKNKGNHDSIFGNLGFKHHKNNK